ncbi:putative metalloprotease CJM1_0395 family protein [Billgrantia saliphila]|uniref:putative metalloprotease CJM1_0395 family protein n=1 Tax=Billgrantia saliphila TaxID=1848458 RepID=UPI001E63CC47|nr:putative metalloprotease CJM1_0395 family protein [Halomonas saliphila]
MTREPGAPERMNDTTSAAHEAANGKVAKGDAPQKPNGETLTEQELRQLDRMKAIDREVRQHELAHQIAGGQYTGGASYEYVRGPDGERYVVAGQVPIDYGPVPGDPRATIGKMQQVISAALAPADPSPKDHQVAASARQYLLTAQLELAQLSRQQHGDTAATSQQDEGDGTQKSSSPRAATPELSQYDIVAKAIEATGGIARLHSEA